MPLIQWSDSFSVKVPSLDAQHAQLIKILNDLHEAMLAQRGRAVLAEEVARLHQYARTHLKTEEDLLQKHGYPNFAEHKAQHDAYLAKVKDIETEMRNGGLTVANQLMRFLKEWWTSHILKTDREYADFLKQRGAA